jgi:hypothetical protein
MQIKNTQKNTAKSNNSNQISIVSIGSLLAIDDASVEGFSIHNTNPSDGEIFLTSNVGIALWGESDGKIHRIEGHVFARILGSEMGPVVELSAKMDMPVAVAHILCIDVAGLGPNSNSAEQLNDYKELLSEVRVLRTHH